MHGLIVGHLDPARQAYISKLRQLVADRGLSERITFTGRRDDMRDIYAVSDIVLSLSNKPESFGRTVLEPLSMGVPTIGYDHGGVGEILARLYPPGRVMPGDEAGLEEKTIRLLESHPSVSQTGEYSLDNMLTSTIGMYEGISA